jgi:AraC family transcriptional regulator of adaptative response/methylated-DNA-[protein]-cysteine methyltransferase
MNPALQSRYDYDRVSRAISFLVDQVGNQPTLDEVAAHVHLSRFHFQRLFSRWAGMTPKRFLQVLTLERAKRLLDESRSLLETADSLGLSSSSRLYDHFVQLEAVTPGEFKAKGAGITIKYGFQETPFGTAFIAITPRGICSLEFVDDGSVERPLRTLAKHWPNAALIEERRHTAAISQDLFGKLRRVDRPLSLHVAGTNFQVSVWKALLQNPPVSLTTYASVAAAIGRPQAARAVGSAIGMNPVAFLIPCHRVIQQTGELGGYRWGTLRKQAIHCWEAARHG